MWTLGSVNFCLILPGRCLAKQVHHFVLLSEWAIIQLQLSLSPSSPRVISADFFPLSPFTISVPLALIPRNSETVRVSPCRIQLQGEPI